MIRIRVFYQALGKPAVTAKVFEVDEDMLLCDFKKIASQHGRIYRMEFL